MRAPLAPPPREFTLQKRGQQQPSRPAGSVQGQGPGSGRQAGQASTSTPDSRSNRTDLVWSRRETGMPTRRRAQRNEPVYQAGRYGWCHWVRGAAPAAAGSTAGTFNRKLWKQRERAWVLESGAKLMVLLREGAVGIISARRGLPWISCAKCVELLIRIAGWFLEKEGKKLIQDWFAWEYFLNFV